MSNKRNLSSQQSIDTVIKLNTNLRTNLLEQLESFNSSKNDYLLTELKKLLEFRDKKIKNQTSYLEINIFQVEKLIDFLHKLEGYNQLKNPSNNLKEKLDKIKHEIVDELIMLPGKLYLESEINQDININYDQHTNNESNFYESNFYETFNKSNNYEPNNYETFNKSNLYESNFYETFNKSNNYESNFYETFNKSNNYEPNNYETFSKSNFYEPNNYETFSKSNFYEPNNYETFNKSNNYEPNNYEPNNYETFNKSNYNDKKINKSVDQINQTINKLKNDEETNIIFSIVFNYLSIKDLLNCRLVNKKFKKFSDQSNGINKLIIFKSNLIHVNYNWFYNGKLIEEKDIIDLECFRSIKKLKLFNLDTNLKHLKIYDSKFKLEEISNLINLESIEFGHYYYDRNEQILNLKNLKVFISNKCVVKLNTPKLEKIQFEDMNQIKFNSNPKSIKHLISNYYINKLDIFKNLEIMELKFMYEPVNENLLIIFKNLKQLKISFFRFGPHERIKNSLIKILNNKIKLKREFDMYLEGIKIVDINKFNELVNVNLHSIWKFRLNNHDLLDLNLSFKYLDYEELEECVNNIKNDLPSSFFDKFIFLNEVMINKVNDIDGLNWFLNNLKYLKRLEIGSKVLLDEVFFNNLPNTIKELNIKSKKDINYDFILKLSQLVEFYTFVDKDLFNLAFKSFLKLKYLNTFKFYFKHKLISIKKNNEYFNLNRENNELNYYQLVEECNKIRSNFYRI